MSKYTLAIIDDETFSLEQIPHLIEWGVYGFKVVIFDDANEFLDYFYHNKVDAVLSDINMPDINGFELIKLVKKQNKDIYVAFLSGHEDFSYAQEAIRLGAKDYLLKPLTLETLINFIKKMKASLDEHLKETEGNLFKELLFLFKNYTSNKADLPEVESFFKKNNLPIDITESPCVIITIDYSLFVHCDSTKIFAEFYDYCIKNKAFCAPLKNIASRLTIAVLFFSEAVSTNHFYAKEFTNQLKNHFKELYMNKIEFVNLFLLSSLDELIDKYTEKKNSDISFSPIDEMKKIIAEKYNTDISLAMIADMLEMNSSYLSRIFRAETGVKYIDYLNNIRIEHSKILLLNTVQNVNTISKNVGYHSRNHFVETFKKITGITPQEFRKQKILN